MIEKVAVISIAIEDLTEAKLEAFIDVPVVKPLVDYEKYFLGIIFINS